MDKFEVKAQRLAALCLLGVLLFNYPILALFNVAGDRVRDPGPVRLYFQRLEPADRRHGVRGRD